jgi:hypothetical protein
MSVSEKLFWIALVGLDVWLASLGSYGRWIAAAVTLACFVGSFPLIEWAKRHIWHTNDSHLLSSLTGDGVSSAFGEVQPCTA